ncbi:hypothetical protein NECAME_09311 [Necator americanus]|uniref:Protein kinase domain-containing protein n=1 Tax=Necator americanus TaxID=51031 RepID=W2TGA2_NECAM|nr:hypothetical protein NECAME_09311 [Necator americanus]ETN80216.1 hypothetical protein NECAME_09311 [Necator americanus]
MSFDLESCERSSSSCSIDDKLPSTNNLIRGKDGQYAVGHKLAQGRYGAVFEVLRKSDGKAFACKLEICSANSHGLDMDYIVMNQAVKKGCNHLVRMIDRGKIEDHFKFLIMPLLGDNLTKIRHQFVDGRLSLSSGLRLSFLALSPIQELHNIGFVHRDIKANYFQHYFLYSTSIAMCLIDLIYLVLQFLPRSSYKPREPAAGAYRLRSLSILQRQKRKSEGPQRAAIFFRGTVRYASLSAHNGEEQSPRDDLESWFYMMVELLSGFLPWSDFHHDSINEVEFRRLQKYLDGLKFNSQPDYTFIAEMVQLAMKNNGVKKDEPFDWEE